MLQKFVKITKTKFLNISRNNYWNEYLDELGGTLRIEPAQLVIEKLEFSNEVKGVYIQ